MCGIAGIIDYKNTEINQGLIQKMTDAVAHRGPDSDGFFLEPGVALGHRRLSIIDLSDAASQPFKDNTGRYTMVFNGEIYNFREVKNMLPEYPFHSTGDTGVLIAAYAKWGKDCISHFQGMFAFAIWDHQERELFLARDRFGVKPLYYYAGESQFLFSSEIRSILASGQVKRKINTEALQQYFYYQSVSGPASIIENIMELGAGEWMKIKEGRINKVRYWDVTQTPSMDMDFSDEKKVQQHIRNLLLKSVEKRLISDVPVGAFLSGGIDSSAVVGLMAETSFEKPNTFNIAFEEKEFDESVYADIISKKFNTRHTRVLLRPTVFLDEMQNALNAMDSPSGDGINTYVVSKEIRKSGITVALSGIGGDELFAGYPIFSQYLQIQKRCWLWKIPGPLRSSMAGILFSGPHPGRKGRIQQLLRADDCSIENTYPILRQIFSQEQINTLTNQTGNRPFFNAIHRELLGRRKSIDALPLFSQVSVAEYLGYTQYTLLKDTDQMSMSVSLEVREPFFDQDLVSFVLSLPDIYKNPKYPKSLLVESLSPLLPEEIVHRKKKGFLFPWNLWLRKELFAFCDQHIKNMADRPFINGDWLMNYWNRFINGDESIRWIEIWLFVVLEYWMEKNEVE